MIGPSVETAAARELFQKIAESADIAVCGEVLRADCDEHCTGGEAGDPIAHQCLSP